MAQKIFKLTLCLVDYLDYSRNKMADDGLPLCGCHFFETVGLSLFKFTLNQIFIFKILKLLVNNAM